MKKNIFAVCDLEVDYAMNFMDHLNQKRNIPFEVIAFTSAEKLKAYAKEHKIELLLISDKAMDKEIRYLDIGKIIILTEGIQSEGIQSKGIHSEGNSKPELEQFPAVYKYQASSQVLREVMACYGREGVPVPGLVTAPHKQVEILGVYSPLHRCLKTSIALTLGQLLAEKKSVLLLCMEEYSGFEELMGKSYEGNLSDLLYFVRQDSLNLVHKINGLVQSIHNLDYIPPVRTPWDIQETTAAQWEKLLDLLALSTSYEVFVLDLGSELTDMFRILDKCTRIYMPVLSDIISRSKIAQFENLVHIWDYDRILEKMVRISPPFHVEFTGGENYITQLPWSQLGDYMRKVLRLA